GFVVVLLEGASQEERQVLATAAERELEHLASVSYVESTRPEVFVRDKALWLMDLEDLRQLERRVRDRYSYAINRYFLDLDDKPPPKVETHDLVERLRRRFGERESSGASIRSSQTDLYENEDMQALFVRPTVPATDLEFS